jgi:hypothetical protein
MTLSTSHAIPFPPKRHVRDQRAERHPGPGDCPANSCAARAAAHGAHNGTSISPSKSELCWPVITASNASQMPRSAG